MSECCLFPPSAKATKKIGSFTATAEADATGAGLRIDWSGADRPVRSGGVRVQTEDLRNCAVNQLVLCSKLQDIPAKELWKGRINDQETQQLDGILAASDYMHLDHMYVKFNTNLIVEMTVHGLVITMFSSEMPPINGERILKTIPYSGSMTAGTIIQKSQGRQQFDALENNCSHFAERIFSTAGHKLNKDILSGGGIFSLVSRNEEVMHKLLDAKFGPIVKFMIEHPCVSMELYKRSPSLKQPIDKIVHNIFLKIGNGLGPLGLLFAGGALLLVGLATVNSSSSGATVSSSASGSSASRPESPSSTRPPRKKRRTTFSS